MQIRKIELLTQSLGDVKAFYNGVLHWPVLHQDERQISLGVGYSTITFKLTTAQIGIYHFALLIPKNKVEEAYRWLKAKTNILPFNAQSDIADFSNWHAQAFYFHDHHQNILELIAHHDLSYTAEEPFTEASIIGVCEMGLVVDDVTDACHHLHKTFGIPYFSKGPYLKDFAVMGEEDGLLIISAKGRGWLPTGQAAAVNGLKVWVEVSGKAELITYEHPG